MTTLEDAIALTTRRLSVLVRINHTHMLPAEPTTAGGVPGVISLRVAKSHDAPVPVCTITLNRVPSWIKRGQPVRVFLGYNGLMDFVFTGTVQQRSRGVGAGTVECTGMSYQAFNIVQVPERDVDGQTVKQAIEALLDYVGIANYQVTDSAPFTLGSASAPKLERATASEMLKTLMDVDGLRMYESSLGTVIVGPFSEIAPSATEFRSYSTTSAPSAFIIEGSDREDPSWLRTRVVFTGATIQEGTEPNQTQRTVQQTAVLANTPLVQPPLPAGTYIDAEETNHLVDTDAKAASVATRLMNKYGRVPRQITLVVPGDPQIELYQTVELRFPELDAMGRFVVVGITQDVSSSAYSTTMELRGGDETGGSIDLAPVADFDFRVDREVIGDRVITTVTFDARRSHDPDGTIVDYVWTDNQTTTPDIGNLGGLAQGSVRIDPAAVSGDWEVTLTVEDASGVTSALMKVVPVVASSTLVRIPAIYAALNNNASVSPDGGEHWKDDVASTCISVGARPMGAVGYPAGLFGYADGSIRQLKNFTSFSTALAAVGSPIAQVGWDWRNPNVTWALTEDWRLYRGNANGLSWVLSADVGDVLGLGASAVAKTWHFPEGTPAFFLFGGDGAGNPVIAVAGDPDSGRWAQLALGGELDADAPAADAQCRIVDVALSPGSGLAIILENADGGTSGVRPIYHATDVFAPSTWLRAIGLDAPLSDGRYILPGALPAEYHAAFNDRNTWSTSDAINWTGLADVMPAGVTPNSAIWQPEVEHGSPLLPAAYLVAAENAGGTLGIYKSTNALASVSALRPATGFPAWPTSAKAKMVTLADEMGIDGRVLFAATVTAPDRVAMRREHEPSWQKSTFVNQFGSNNLIKTRALTSDLWLLCTFVDKTNYNSGIAVRTEDGGVTWNTMADPATNYEWQDFCLDAGGRVWGLAVLSTDNNQARIYYSDASGDAGTWTLARSENQSNQRLFHIVAHPTMQDRVYALGVGAAGGTSAVVVYTTDRGATWTRNVDTLVFASNLGHETNAMVLPSGRIVWAGGSEGGGTAKACVVATDDSGIFWKTKLQLDTVASGDHCLGPTGLKMGQRLYVLHEDASEGKTYVWYSDAQGETGTWTRFTNEVPRQAAGKKHKGGLAYDEREDALYVLLEGGLTANDQLVMRLSPVDPEAVAADWEDFSDAAVPIGAFTSYTVVEFAQSIAVIP